MKIKKVLVANRGEIAIRVFRACYDLGINTVAVYSKEDENSLFRTKADEAYLIGENKSPLGAYLDMDAMIQIAKRHDVDAIHPGYGFLSENAEFARRCEANGIQFIGPPSQVLGMMGDKLSAKEIAKRCHAAVIPGSEKPLKNVEEAIQKAELYKYPVILKASAGGGGRGMRRCNSAKEVRSSFDLVRGEAKKAFDSEDIFLEKYLEEPKHIEVQILADHYGHVVHLYERDCSLQRRYQKVVEFTPAFTLTEEKRKVICDDAVKIAQEVGYVNAGTVEFLVDKNGDHYFIEMNPRIQVEHTVTEMVTGVDLVRAQILIAGGEALTAPDIGIGSQEDIVCRGYSIQCRVTTENPKNNFAPDTGKITAYRSGGGFGVRLDGGNTYSGAEVSPYYDSLLVKITTHDNTFSGACRKALRMLHETSVRGLKTNIGFIGNILNHPKFLEGTCHTKFIDETPELFKFDDPKDRATKMLNFIGDIIINDPDAGKVMYDIPRFPKVSGQPLNGVKQILDQLGPEAVKAWVLQQKKLLITDTTLRDAHQSLLATRLRTRDMVKCAEATAEILNDAFSLEMWGGATFDVSYRFLHESPWERLALLRERIQGIPFQMLLRGANAVGYTNYPDNLIREFIKEAAKSGIDVFRIFDSLNWIPGMEIAIDEVLKVNKIAEGTICYTGDISNPKEDKWTLNYYVDMAKKLEKLGAHILCIKDMSGLLKPYAAGKLVKTLKQEVGLPIHLHTHDTSGNQIAALLMAAEAGVDIVDVAISSMASNTSQPALNSLAAALEGQERDTGLDSGRLQELTEYWSDVRLRYKDFEGGITHPETDIYRYEIPGGQYTNLKPQVESLGLGNRFDDVKEMYKTVNDMLGGIVKVTPSSKMVGDLAIFMVQNDLTPENIVERGRTITFPDSAVSYFKGMMGQPSWGFPEELQKVVLKGEEPITGRPGEILEPVDFEAVRIHLQQYMEEPDWQTVISWCFYPKVVEEYLKKRHEYGYITRLGSHVFFHGLAEGETNRVNIEDGKTLVIKYLGKGDLNADGTRNVMFELNGIRRYTTIQDKSVTVVTNLVQMADVNDLSQVSSSIPGMVAKLQVKQGDQVKKNQTLMIVEAMKMETNIAANMEGTVGEILVNEGAVIKAGELLMKLEVG